MYEKIKIGFTSLIIGLICSTCAVTGYDSVKVDTGVVEVMSVTNNHENKRHSIETIEIKPLLTQEEIELIALVTMAEARGESELGQRLVIDVILNRVDRGFGDTVHDVIYKPNQFTSVWDGQVDKCRVTEDVRKMVVEELHNRTNTDVLYFRTKHFHKFGTPLFQEGAHYFSTN